jgi:hypothetical protein
MFPGQQDDERICLVIRRHWSIFARHFLTWLVFVAVLLASHYAISQYLPGLLLEPQVQIVNLAETVYLMFLILSLLIMWTIYYLNVQIITSERVVDITQKSLLIHTISELSLNRIQDVTAEVHGFLETFLDYGNVYLQTAGETERFVFNNVGNPTKVAKTILDLYDQLPAEEKAKGRD